MVYITTGLKEEAKKIGTVLIEERLAACVNIIPEVVSLYHYEGKIVDDTESVLIVKTDGKKVDALVKRVKELHSYTCPCILTYPADGGFPDYITWVGEQTAAPSDRENARE